MRESVMTTRLVDKATQSVKEAGKYHSVEISMMGTPVHYQFKIWCMGSIPMCFLVKENSDILNRLKVGDTLEMKYYSNDTRYPPEYLTTLIKDISRKEQGRFKGHCLVGLQILEN
jgi:hypothetical protein